MSRNPEVRILIDAPPAVVWETLSQLAEYEKWNPLIQFYEGEASVGKSVLMSVKLFGRTLKEPVVFQVLDDEREFRWVGGSEKMMCGSHYFKLEAVGEAGEKTELVQGEEFSGLLLPLLWPFLKKELDRLYRGINEAIKTRSEALVASREMNGSA